MSKKLSANLMLLVAALIWGSTFVAQTTASASVKPFTFLFSRFIACSIAAQIVTALLDPCDFMIVFLQE